MSFKANMQQMIASFEGMPMADLHKTIDDLRKRRDETNRKLSAAHRAWKNKTGKAKKEAQ